MSSMHTVRARTTVAQPTYLRECAALLLAVAMVLIGGGLLMQIFVSSQGPCDVVDPLGSCMGNLPQTFRNVPSAERVVRHEILSRHGIESAFRLHRRKVLDDPVEHLLAQGDVTWAPVVWNPQLQALDPAYSRLLEEENAVRIAVFEPLWRAELRRRRNLGWLAIFFGTMVGGLMTVMVVVLVQDRTILVEVTPHRLKIGDASVLAEELIEVEIGTSQWGGDLMVRTRQAETLSLPHRHTVDRADLIRIRDALTAAIERPRQQDAPEARAKLSSLGTD